MRSLFVKMFLTFWLSLIGGGMLVFLLSPWLRSEHSRLERALELRENWMNHNVEAVQKAYAAGGVDGVDGYLRAVEERVGVRLYLIPALDSSTARQAPAPLVEWAERGGPETERPAHTRWRGPAYLSRWVKFDSESRVLLVADGPIRSRRDEWGPGGRRRGPRGPRYVLLALLTSSGLFCIVAVRSLSKPIRRMRDATQEMSVGNLDVRVGDSVGKRKDELAQLARDFDHMAERIASFRETEQQLLRDVSHELRSPLARLRVALELARQSSASDDAPSLDRIEREAERLDAIIGQLLALVRQENQGDPVMQESIDLYALVEELVADANFEGQQRAITVAFTGVEGCHVLGEKTQLSSAIENVIRNALFYTPEETQVSVTLASDGTAATVSICDAGPGVPEEALADLFRPFFRVAEARERDSGGVGLGLAIAERVVRLHGGSISARNQESGGLCVEISLPQSP